MAREHLYKAKRKDNGEWVYGTPTKVRNKTNPCIVENLFECDEYACYDAICHKVDENTICEYTGLKDKNGTKIFEGDIVKRVEWGNEIFCVEFYEGAFGHKISKDIMISFSDSGHGAFGEWFEVIGNKFDNDLEEQDEKHSL